MTAEGALCALISEASSTLSTYPLCSSSTSLFLIDQVHCECLLHSLDGLATTSPTISLNPGRLTRPPGTVAAPESAPIPAPVPTRPAAEANQDVDLHWKQL